MYKKILVPLDGSKLAECVLPHVEAIATGCRVGKVVFVRVAEPIQLAMAGADFQLSADQWTRIEEEQKADARAYLNDVTKRTKWAGVEVQVELLIGGRAADVISDYSEQNGVDLIVIATHGRSGVGRWVWGSVADRLLRATTVPILMVQARGCEANG